MISRIGEVVNSKYRLIRLLGDGGMGAVYEAQHEVLGTRVAIKVLHSELARRSGLGERFLQEARVAAQIRSPHVVQVIDVDRTSDGVAFIVMELLEGEPLSSVLDRQSRLPISTAGEYTIQILEALDAAHSLGVIHRDLKPENVFVTFLGGRPVLKLIDFGIAKLRSADPATKNLTIAGVLMGTAEYMAPEQARSAAEADARSDLYAVGVMLYEMIAGTRPVLGDDARVIALKVERGEVTPLVQAVPDVPRELAGLVHRAMAGRPALRFSSATEMRLALASALIGKRAATAQLAAAPAAAANESALDASGTGTLKGAPANEVLAAAASRMANDAEPSTQRAPAMGAALRANAPQYVQTPQPFQSAPQAPAYHAAPPGVPRRRRGFPLWIFAIPVAIGAVVLLVLSVSEKSGPQSWKPDDPASPSGKTASNATAGASPTYPSNTPGLKPLDPADPHPTYAGGGGGTVPVAIPSGLPSSMPSSLPSAVAALDASAPAAPPGIVFALPDGGSFSIPTSIPTTFPSTFPSTLPSGFPFLIPTAPPTTAPTASTPH